MLYYVCVCAFNNNKKNKKKKKNQRWATRLLYTERSK